MDNKLPLNERLDRMLWNAGSRQGGGWRPRLSGFARVIYVLGRDLASGELNLRAMSLVYTTLLSLVPMLALAFSVLKAFGIHNQLEPMLAAFLEPLGEQGVAITGKVLGFIENISVGVLGAAGLGY